MTEGIRSAPLAPSMRRAAESSLGVDLGDVAVHRGTAVDREARDMGALAYTIGQDIYLGGSVDNTANTVLAHEVAHTVQQRAGSLAVQAKELAGPSHGQHEVEADAAAMAIMSGRPARVSPMPVQIARFEPSGHRSATVVGLRSTFSAREIGAIYTANWERDFSQSTPEVADLVLSWKLLKESAAENGGMPTQDRISTFEGAVMKLLDIDLSRAGRESMSGYHSWEHMDEPGLTEGFEQSGGHVGPTGKRRRKPPRPREGLSRAISRGKAYVKDQMIEAIRVYRIHKGKPALSDDGVLDPWSDVEMPKGYDREAIRKAAYGAETDTPDLSRDVIREEVQHDIGEQASDEHLPGSHHDCWKYVGHHLGRAMHAMEDFFAHSNWLELATGAYATGQFPSDQDLVTGTFGLSDVCHSLGHRLASLADHLESELPLLMRIFGRSTPSRRLLEENEPELLWDPEVEEPMSGKDALRPLEHDAWTRVGELVDVYNAGSSMEWLIEQEGYSLSDFLTSPEWIAAVRAKGVRLIEEGESGDDLFGHAALAKDTQEHAGHEEAIALAARANELVFAPLRAIMDMRVWDAERLLNKQLELVDKVIAAPGPDHPLWDMVVGRAQPVPGES